MKDNFGVNPWHQTNWDFRAAFNFIFGGAGSGLLVIAAFSGLAGNALRAELLLGMALIGAVRFRTRPKSIRRRSAPYPAAALRAARCRRGRRKPRSPTARSRRRRK